MTFHRFRPSHLVVYTDGGHTNPFADSTHEQKGSAVTHWHWLRRELSAASDSSSVDRNGIYKSLVSAAFDASELYSATFFNLFKVIDEMASLPEGVDQAIDEETKDEAEKVLGYLTLYDIPPPEVFSHGGDAVVFTWEMEKVTKYVTVSGGELGVLDVNRVSHAECTYPQIPLHSAVLDQCLMTFPRLPLHHHAAE